MTKEERNKLIIETLGGYQIPCYDMNKKEKYKFIESTGPEIPDLSTPNGFFWWWKRAQKMDWWEVFCGTFNYSMGMTRGQFLTSIIDPGRGACALAEFLEERKK